MDRISNSINNEINNSSESPPPPPYNSLVYKKDDDEFDRIQSSTYFDNSNQPFVYFNNYPGPPLTDGHVQIDQINQSINHDHIISKNIRIYLILNGIITIICGFISIAIQISIIASHLIIYYYYGFWGGLFLIFIGLSTIALYNHHRTDYSKLSYLFFWQSAFVGILLGVGIIIILTDKCNDKTTENDNDDHKCRNSYRVLNGFLLGTFAVIFLQSIIHGLIFLILKRKHSLSEISFS
ncbi:unnamed protein product [Rotaria sp. Silwood1]|nr:unnamed protein product [Rotaria sp. Silwood1]CAF1607749.1 unnamed protein product [Rotaria sp. Silwood1]CAF5015922.1 unnamed protein product [Rotaria sp. Silwood1]